MPKARCPLLYCIQERRMLHVGNGSKILNSPVNHQHMTPIPKRKDLLRQQLTSKNLADNVGLTVIMPDGEFSLKKKINIIIRYDT